MKRLIGIVLSIALVLGFGGAAHAFEVIEPNASGNTRIETGKSIDDTVLTSGQHVDIRGDVAGDLFAAGNTLTVVGDVTGNVISGGATVTISGDVTGDVIVAGGTVTINESSTVSGDVLLFAGTVDVYGTIAGDLTTYAGIVQLDGAIAGNMVVQTDKVLFGDTASVAGTLTGTVGQALADDVAPKIGGDVDVTLQKNAASINTAGIFAGFGAISALSVVYSVLAVIVTGLVLVFLLPKLVEQIRKEALKSTVPAAVTGLVLLVLAPILFIIGMIFFVTIPLGLIEITAFALLAMLGSVFANLWVGDLISKQSWSPFTSLAIGAVILTILGLIPIIGSLISLLAWLIGVGSVATVSWRMISKAGK